MKHILKDDEAETFRDWKSLANDDWQPDYDIMPGDIKQPLKQALMKEQGGICCYCESRLIEDDSHVEHFYPQHHYPERALDYDNLLCSCLNQLETGAPRHCGNLKDNWFYDDLLISPLEPGCEQRFAYDGQGKIRPRIPDDLPAQTTITKLGLDIPKLNELRAKAIEPFLDDSLDNAAFTQFVTGYLRPNSNGWFNEFHTTIAYLFTQEKMDISVD